MDSRHTKRSGKVKTPKADVQQVLVKLDRGKHREWRSRLAKHGLTVASRVREKMEADLLAL